MNRVGVEIGLTVLLAAGAVLSACHRPCGAGWSGCCPAPAAATQADGPPAVAAKPVEPHVPVPRAADKPVLVPKPQLAWHQKKRLRGLQWEGMNLDQAVAYLGTVTGKKFTISPKVREEKFESIEMNLALDDVSVKDVLDLITAPWNLRWEVRDGVVWILTNEEFSGPLRLRYYELRDLVVPTPKRAADADAAPRPAPVLNPERVGQLLKELRSQVFPGYWEREDVSLEVRKIILIARAHRAVHNEIDTFLTAKREAMSRQPLSDAMREKLEAVKVTLDASDTTVANVIKILQIQTGMNLMIDPRFAADAAESPVTGIKVESTSLWTALQMLASAASDDAVWADRGNVVMLTRPEFLGRK